jgi:hypothetical protein
LTRNGLYLIFFFDNGNVSSKSVYNKICNSSGCDDDCGYSYGFSWLDPNSSYYINSIKKNESHDLRLLDSIKENINDMPLNQKPTVASFVEVDKILNKVVYGVGIDDEDEKNFGTEENTRVGKIEKKIFNVNDAYQAFKSAIDMPSLISINNTVYLEKNKLGNLHIYQDGRDINYEKYVM